METEMERRNKGCSRLLNKQPLYALVDLPIELPVCIISFVSARDRMKMRYVSQQLRAAVDIPSLWRNFTWPHFDSREERSIRSLFKSCGRHVRQLSFPDLVIPVESLQHCGNIIRLSLPSVKLSLDQTRTIMQYMKKLQYLDILWASKNDIEHLLLTVWYYSIKELTIREQVKDSSFDEALHFFLNEWTTVRLMPHTINIVTKVSSVLVGRVLGDWVQHSGTSTSTDHIGHLNIYRTGFTVGLVPTPPLFQYQIFGPHYCLKRSFVNARNYGLLGLNGGILLTNRIISNSNVIHKGTMRNGIHGAPLNINNIKFLTHFNAAECGFFYSGHLEQLAIACPNIQQLNLWKNVNCLKNLRGLRVIATCKKLEGLNIAAISVKDVESCVQLWEILVDLQLTYLAVDLCCLLCFEGNDQTKGIIIGLHQKCLKMKALESHCHVHCAECLENKQSLQLSNFPLLIHCVTIDINNVYIYERLRYLWYRGDNQWWPWSIANCNLQELYIESDQLALPHSFMNKISAHGGLVHVILNVHRIPLKGIAALIEKSPNLITYHVYVQTHHEADWFIISDPKDFRPMLEKKYSHRKLFLCGSYRLVKGKLSTNELDYLLVNGNMDFVSVWRHAM